MSSEFAIAVADVSKCFHIYDRPQNRLKQSILPRLQRAFGQPERVYFRQFWAVRDASFTVEQGETVGVIGRNGSGKSTLLQMICGTLMPTSGSIQTRGRIGALLELGSGFNPDFSGRDNVYMNASLLGLTRAEIDGKFDSIVRFAEIGSFIDEPVKTYSSGMMVRLAFAVQSQIEPDILIVDEALAVGDAKFQAKCFDRLKKLKENGTSILLVTHSSEQIVTHCDRAILLESGRALAMGVPRTVVNQYLDLLFSKAESPAAPPTQPQEEESREGSDPSRASLEDGFAGGNSEQYGNRPNFNPGEYRWGDGAARITDFRLTASGQAYPSSVEAGQPIELRLAIAFETDVSGPIIGFTIKSKEGVTIYGCNTESLSLMDPQTVAAAGARWIVSLDLVNRLGPGDYFISTGVASRQQDELTPHDRRYDSIHLHVSGNQQFHGLVDLSARIHVTSDRPVNV